MFGLLFKCVMSQVLVVDFGVLLKFVIEQRVIESYYRIVIIFFSICLDTLLALFKVVSWFSGIVFISIFFLFD